MRVTRLTTTWLTAAALCVLTICSPAAAAAPMPGPNPAWQVNSAPPVHAGGAILMDWTTGRVLYQRNAFQPRDPASTTKILTALIALEKGRLDDKVTVSKRAAYTPGSSMYIKPGEVYSLHDLLHGLLLRSGNDAAAAIAEHIAGSVENFAVLMNARSKQIGTTVSRWVNPHGLTAPGHVSSAYDLALIAREALHNPTFQRIVSTRQTPLKYEYLHRDVVLHNTNRLLFGFDGADGVKTGTTAAAGACLVASATRDEHKLLAVVLHAGDRWRDSGRLLEWGFGNFRLATLGAAGEVVVEARVLGGRQLAVPLALTDQMAAVVPRKGAEVPKLELQVQEPIAAPIKKGQALGRARFQEDGKVLGETVLVAAADVPKATLFDYLMRLFAPLVRWGHDLGAF